MPAADQPPNSLTLTVILRAPAERIYRAFLDPAAIAKWNTPHGFTTAVHHIDPTEGGQYQMSFANFGTQETHQFTGAYTQLQPNRRIQIAGAFDDLAIPGQITMTADLEETPSGTRLTITQSGPPLIPPDEATLGWQESLQLLKYLVEPNIPSPE